MAFSLRTSKERYRIRSIFQGLQEEGDFQLARTWQGHLPDPRRCQVTQSSQNLQHSVRLMLAIKNG
jgi:hypothetical protein